MGLRIEYLFYDYYNYDEATVGLYFYDFIDYCYRGSPLDLLQGDPAVVSLTQASPTTRSSYYYEQLVSD